MHSPEFIVASVIAVLIWVYLLLGRGAFWQVSSGNVVFNEAVSSSTPVAVVIPARNEAEVVARCISSLLQQTCESIQIFLVDDFSCDNTTLVAREVAQKAGKSASLATIECGPQPLGWTGKLWAVHTGIKAASRLNARFLLLTDADVVHAPHSIATLLKVAETGGYDLVSVTGRLDCETFAEKLLIPAFTFFFLMLYPPAWIADSHRRTAGADGGCMLIRPEALARAGGIESIRDAIIDDCSLAKTIKRSGGKLYLGVSTLTSSIRRHESFAKIGRLISRTAFSQLHHSSLMLFATLLGLAVTYVVPLVMTFSASRVPTVLGLVAWAAMTISYFPVIRFYGLKPQWSLVLPIVALFYMGATVWSALQYWSSKGGEWKGRVQDPDEKARSARHRGGQFHSDDIPRS
jgi:hopene-associated glycosyltransferase HpnB